jgi:NitT/TauT family transport system permease protein
MCCAYGVPRARVLRGVYLPSAVPYFLSAVRTSLGLAWKAGIAAEVLTSAKNSIGKEIFEAKQYMETVNLFAWTLVVIILSLVIEKLVLAMLDRLGGRVRKEVSHAERA